MKYSRILGLLLISTGVSAAPSNPPSMSVVEEAIAAAFSAAVKQSTYTAGTAISILNNVVSGNYQAGAGITINGDTISGSYQAGDSTIIVDNTAGTIIGNYQAGTDIAIVGNTISATGPVQAYTAGAGLSLTGTEFAIALSVPDTTLVIDNAAGTIAGNYQAGSGITISGNQIIATGAAQPYAAGAGLSLTGTTFSTNLALPANDVTLAIDNVNGTIAGNYQAGAGITIDNSTGVIAQSPTYALGDTLEGGTIFYLDDTKRHGLMVLTSALTGGTAKPLTLSTTTLGQAFANGIGAGMVNSQYWLSKIQTDLDIAGVTTGNIGATAVGSALNVSMMFNGSSYVNCPTGDGNASKTCFGGWYLPSLNELSLLYTQLLVTSFCSGSSNPNLYWSSTSTPSGTSVTSSTNAYVMNFSNGSVETTLGVDSASLCATPIRQF
tara:strand:- start:33832 stop:35142 length:1311 start_codon:yes stop_codon:yes gene_type:complete